MFLLDTDHLTILQERIQPEVSRLQARMAARAQTEFSVSVVSFHEQTLGWNSYLNRSRDTAGVIHGYRMLLKMLRDFAAAQVLPFDTAPATVFDNLRAQRIRVPTMALRIVAIALSRGFTLLTRNVRDFAKVPGLKFEDWTA